MEAMAVLYAMKSPCDYGWRKLSCESDSQVVIHLLNQKLFEVVNWKLALIANKTHNLCTSLELITFTHIPREWNSVVDCLAKWLLIMSITGVLLIRLTSYVFVPSIVSFVGS